MVALVTISAGIAAGQDEAYLGPLDPREIRDDRALRADEPILPDAVSADDVTLRGPYVREWRDSDGAIVLAYEGGFRLESETRTLRADAAVVWIESRTSATVPRRYYELTVYLSGHAEVAEAAGTLTQDANLLVSNIRTRGQVIRYQDVSARENLEGLALYQRALGERMRYAPRGADGEEPAPVDVEAPGITPRQEKPPRPIRYSFGAVDAGTTSDGKTVQYVTGGVYLVQSGTAEMAILEIRAQRAVIFPGRRAGRLFGDELEGEVETGDLVAPQPPEPSPEGRLQPVPQTQPGGDGEVGGLPGVQTLSSDWVSGVYLEGDVVISIGERFVRADRIYYDFGRNRALILDAVMRVEIPGRTVPLYVRANELRQLSEREYAAQGAMVTTSEFASPHYHVGVDRLYLRDRTERDARGRATSPIRGTYEMYNATLNVRGYPLAYWPYSQGDLQASETMLRGVQAAYGGERGAALETSWHLFGLLGLTPPPGYDAELELDFFSDRGPALGINSDYRREDYFGLFRSYYVHDDGEDNLGPLRNNEPSTHDRGRLLWRHRHYLPNEWELTLEYAYVSDDNFLEEWRKNEWFEGKEQETVIFLKRALDTEAFTFLANWRTLDFVTQTEHLPEVTYRRIGDTWFSPLVLYSEARFGAVRYRPDDRRFFDRRIFNNDGMTDSTIRFDVREEAEVPLKFPGLNVVPFGTVRGTIWDGQPLGSGRLWRGFGLYGVRGSAYFARVFDDVKSELFDIHRIRHIVLPHFAAWYAHSNADSEIITPFDEGIETIDDFYGTVLGVRQIWQTKRGVDRDRTVDLLELNIEAGFFGKNVQDEESNGYVNIVRPEDSRTRNYVGADLIYRLSDTTSLLYEANFDLNDHEFDRHNISIAVERLPRLAYVFGYRHAGDIDLDLIGGGYNFKLNEKHITSVRAWYDLERNKLGEISAAYIRKFPRWYVAFNVDVDEVFDDVKFTISVWPEGIPEWTLGSRRFTGLSSTTGIRP